MGGAAPPPLRACQLLPSDEKGVAFYLLIKHGTAPGGEPRVIVTAKWGIVVLTLSEARLPLDCTNISFTFPPWAVSSVFIISPKERLRE